MDHTVTYRYGRRDYVAAMQANVELGPLGRLGRWGRYACFALFIVVLLNLQNILSWSLDAVSLIVSAIMIVGFLAVAPLGEFVGYQFASLFMFPTSGSANKDCTFVFGESGIELKQVDIEGRIPWQSITNILETKDYLFLRVGRTRMIAVPRRALPSDDAAAELATYIRSKVTAAAAA